MHREILCFRAATPDPKLKSARRTIKKNIHKLISGLTLLTALAAQTASGFYDPVLQRWLTLDPIGEAGGINLYQFVGNDPVNKIDPWGHEVLIYYTAPNGQPTARPPDIGYYPARDKAVALVGAGFVPGVGEAMDVDVLTDPESAWWEKALAGTSLSLNAITESLLPNAGAFLKGGKSLCKAPAQVRKAAMSYDDIKRQIAALDFGTPRNSTVFWTGYRQGNQGVALQWAKANGKYTIEISLLQTARSAVPRRLNFGMPRRNDLLKAHRAA
ncbi:MAG: RHS repeat-associated core domain-containing protein [Verrucomicrobia bacterium]|nr:RHS repeat-associated core domain-containing protein [Verrucomicrobiota bacterium]